MRDSHRDPSRLSRRSASNIRIRLGLSTGPSVARGRSAMRTVRLRHLLIEIDSLSWPIGPMQGVHCSANPSGAMDHWAIERLKKTVNPCL